jgi:hypothetical protein
MYQYYSQKWTILRWLQDTGSQKASFFQKWRYFVGYKFGARVAELIKVWLVIHSKDEKWENGQTFAIYSLTEAWQDYKIPRPTLFERIKHNFNF